MKFLDLKQEDSEIKEEINKAIQKVLDSGYFIGGEEVAKLEQEIAKYCGVKFAISTNSGTDALYLSLKALGIGKGDEVITTPFTFVATVGTIVNVGARPVFVDINSDDFNINQFLIEEKITKKTKAIIPVHLFGKPAEMKGIMEIAKKHNLFVIEDAAQALGSECDGKKVGSIGNIGCLSFYPTKNLGAYGDAGMILTNSEKFNTILRVLKNHGINNIPYFSEMIGINSRLDTFQAAILRVKLNFLDGWIYKRKENAEYYCQNLKMYYWPDSSYNQFTIRVKDNRVKLNFPTMIYYPIPLHLQFAFKFLNYNVGDFPKAEKASREVISLPLLISRKEQDEVIKKIKPHLWKK